MVTQLLQTTLYTKDIPAGADTLSHYCDRGRLFITLGTSPVLLLIKERCFTMISHAFHKELHKEWRFDAHQIVRARLSRSLDVWQTPGIWLIWPFHDQVQKFLYHTPRGIVRIGSWKSSTCKQYMCKNIFYHRIKPRLGIFKAEENYCTAQALVGRIGVATTS